MNDAARENLEELLLDRIRERLPSLEALLERCGSHWSYEDPIYRFYHGSWKVYALQGLTAEIVAILASLCPEAQLNKFFLQIVSEGTGKTFTRAANANWLATTRPILEAFFHARFFLEMIVRYGKALNAPAEVLPSGWAAVLYLYNLR